MLGGNSHSSHRRTRITAYLLLALFFHATRAVLMVSDGSGSLSAAAAAAASEIYIGGALTFSGGTFLFVAIHALEDATDSPGPDAGEGGYAPHGAGAGEEGHSHAHGDHPHAHPQEKDWVSKPAKILLLLTGALLPKLLQILTGGHSH